MSDGSEGDSGDAGPTTTPTPTPTPAAAWRYCLHIAYLGTGFVGWQRQHETSKAGHGSIQELVEDAVTAVLAAPRRVNVTSVSRTDAGTHALYVRAKLLYACMYDR
jgi:tRNA pseudouridine38-40 synthase